MKKPSYFHSKSLIHLFTYLHTYFLVFIINCWTPLPQIPQLDSEVDVNLISSPCKSITLFEDRSFNSFSDIDLFLWKLVVIFNGRRLRRMGRMVSNQVDGQMDWRSLRCVLLLGDDHRFSQAQFLFELFDFRFEKLNELFDTFEQVYVVGKGFYVP